MADEPVVTPAQAIPGTAPAPAAPGTADAAQAALKASDVKPGLLGPDGKPVVAEPAKAEDKKAEPKADEKKSDDKKAAPALDPKALKLPDGFTADEASITSLTEILSNEKLEPQARAQQLVDLHTKALQQANTKAADYWRDTTAKWTKEVATDKDIGSGNEKSPLKPEAKQAIAKVIDSYGGNDLREALDMTGAGNHPAIIRAFHKMAKELTEGRHVQGSAGGGGPKTGAEIMFPDNPRG